MGSTGLGTDAQVRAGWGVRHGRGGYIGLRTKMGVGVRILIQTMDVKSTLKQVEMRPTERADSCTVSDELSLMISSCILGAI